MSTSGPLAADLIPTEVDDPEEANHETREAKVTPAQHAQRLDRCVVSMAPEFSRSHLQTLIEAGHVKVDGLVQRTASRKLRVGQALWLELVPTAQSQAFKPEPMALEVVYED